MKYTVYVTAQIDKAVQVDASDKLSAFELAEEKVCRMLRSVPDVTAVDAYDAVEEE